MEDAVDHKIWFRHWPQHLAAFLAAQSAMCAGVVLGWTSPVLPALQDNSTTRGEHDEGPLTDEQGSWIASLTPLGALVGASAAGLLADRFGRKRSILGTVVPFFVGALLATLSQSVVVLYSSRFISGLAIGIVTTVVPMYCEEIAEPKLRGALGVYLELMLNVGILWSYIMGFMVPYVWFTATSSVLPVLFFAAFLWMPESPVYLMAYAREEAAGEALLWLRGAEKQQTNIFTAELHQLKKMFPMEKDRSAREKGTCMCFVNLVRNFSWSCPTSRACFVIFGLILCQQAAGIDILTFYVVSILQDAGTAVSPFVSGAIVGFIQLVASGISLLTVDHLGRRFLLLSSLISICVSYFLLALNSALMNMDIETKFYSWVPLFAMCIYFVAFSLGIGPLPWFMMAELAPMESKEIIGSAVITFSWVLAFLVSKFFISLFVLIGSLMTYALLCAMSLLGTIFVALFVPETKGKTREEIEEYFCKRIALKKCSIKL